MSEQKYSFWFQVADRKISTVTQDETNKKKNWLKGDNTVSVGEEFAYYELVDDVYTRIHDDVLVERGIRKDNRGIWYNKETLQPQTVSDLDVEAPANATKEKPIENEPFQKWDEDEKKWAVDAEKKMRAEKEDKLWQLKAQIEDAEKRIQRSSRAILQGRATPKDQAIFEKYDSLIESLRPEVTVLETELKKSAA